MTHFERFRMTVFSLDYVTYVGPEHHVSIGVESEEHVEELRQLVHPSVPIFVTGPICADVPKHPGVQTYEKVAEETKP